eukprot:CAMPEP_0197075808 /NCGR_PEP_ID=MMETSP1384-20130603/211795_1 /TAXON_ID=29189 /ORGANISM="Ammonia sp." /LENGTH=610 /DNA_ID=CAMNT_0042514657 /DNA_START=150 /DNA_END=1982 /DNA_ORIENTATION=-
MNLAKSAFITAFALSLFPFGGHADGLDSSVVAQLQSRAATENGIAWVHAIYAPGSTAWTFYEPFNDLDGFVDIAQYATSIKFTSPSGTWSSYATECSNPVWALNICNLNMNPAESAFITAFALSLFPFGGHAVDGLDASVLAAIQSRVSAPNSEDGIAFVHAIWAPSTGSAWTFYEPFSDMDAFVEIAQYATSIKFNSPSGAFSSYATECSNPVWALNHGLELSQTYDVSTGLVTGYSDTSDWNGNTAQMANYCRGEHGTTGTSLTVHIFDACGMASGGLHVITNSLHASWWARENGVNIYLGFDVEWSSDCYGNALSGDVDECELETHSCDENADCTNTDGSYTCECNDGYGGDGYTCADIDECALETDACSENAVCTNIPGYYECACNDGYSGNGFECVDDDECSSGTHSCDGNADCTNTDGSYVCECNDGYSGDGFTCTDIDECALETDECSDNAACTNLPGSYTCECNDGYSGDGFACVDDDECALGTDDCKGQGVECVNVAGSFECVCTNVVETTTSCLQGALQCTEDTSALTGLIEQHCECVAGAVVPYSYMYTAACLLVLSYVALYYVMKMCFSAKPKPYAAVNVKYSDSDIEESEAQVINVK